MLAGRVVMVVWTPRDAARHIISMRHCHEREARKVRSYLD
ncbi:BrnT family toxin [Aquabacter sp. CN5-332]